MRQFLSQFSITKKLFFLLATVFLGFILLVLASNRNLVTMKEKVNQIYGESFSPVGTLRSIKALLVFNIVNSVLEYDDGLKDPQQIYIELNQHYSSIKQTWSQYRAAKSKAYTSDVVDNDISNLLIWANGLSNKVRKKEKLKLHKIINYIASVDMSVTQLIKEEQDIAYQQQINSFIDETIFKIFILLLFITIIIVFISALIIQNIRESEKQQYELTEKLEVTNKKLASMAITDPLTGLFNRRHFLELSEQELIRARRNSGTLVFMMIDVDHFKKYNDTYGHQMGDTVLVAVASAISECFHRASDSCFRLGGEEFGVFFLLDNGGDSIVYAEKFVQKIRDLAIVHKSSDTATYVTISLGLVVRKINESTRFEAIVKDADTALYKAKEDGRDGVVTFNELN